MRYPESNIGNVLVKRYIDFGIYRIVEENVAHLRDFLRQALALVLLQVVIPTFVFIE